MVSQRLINYIKDDLKGHDKGEIKKILVEQGYPEELADNAIKAAVEANEQEKETEIKEEEKEKKRIKELKEERESRKEQLKAEKERKNKEKGIRNEELRIKREESKKKFEGLKKKTAEKSRKNSEVLILILIIIILGASFFVFNGFFNNIRCSMMKDQGMKDHCYFDVAKKTRDINACYDIEDYNQRLYCCIEITDRSSSICDIIKNQEMKDRCCLNVAEKTGDINACYDIEDYNQRLNCIGITDFNLSVCDMISEQKIKEYCYQGINKKRENILIASGWPWGIYFPTSKVIVKICNLSTSKRECSDVLSRGSIRTIMKINQEKVNLAIVDSSIAYNAYEGNEMFESNKIETIRGVISLFPEFIQIVVRSDSNIYSLDGLMNKKILMGSEKWGINPNAKLILENKGILDKVEIILKNQDMRDAMGLPGTGQIDSRNAIKLLENVQVDAIFTVSSIPNKVISKLDEKVSLRVIPIEDSLRDILISENKFYTKGVIPVGTYSGMESNVNTLSINSILITNKEEDEEFIYNLTKNLFENQTFFNTYIKPYIEEAKEGLCIPLHKGAERYYKEKGLI